MPDVFIDGFSTLAQADGPVEFGIDMETRARWWRTPLCQLGTSWAPLPQLSEAYVYTNGGVVVSYLVEESEPKSPGADIYTWSRTWSEWPQKHNTAANTAFAFQGIVDGNLIDVPIGTTATVVNDYFYTNDPGTIAIFRGFKYVKVGNGIYFIGDKNTQNNNLIPASDSTIERWKGPFWRRGPPFVNKAAIIASVG